MRFVWSFTPVLALAACSNPPPKCAPKGDGTYQICSDDKVWTCPAGDAQTVSFNQQIDAECQASADPIQCVLDASKEYKYVEMTLAEDCAAAKLVCVEDFGAMVQVASCEQPT